LINTSSSGTDQYASVLPSNTLQHTCKQSCDLNLLSKM